MLKDIEKWTDTDMEDKGEAINVPQDSIYYATTSFKGNGDSFYLMPAYEGYEKAIKELAKRDGFKSAKEMFKWFDKNYDLYKSPRKFVVYRWKGL